MIKKLTNKKSLRIGHLINKKVKSLAKGALPLFQYEGKNAMLIIDLETQKYVDCNKKMEELSGYSYAELMEMKVGTMTKDSLPQKRRNFENLEPRQQIIGMNEMIRADGEKILIRYSSSYFFLGGHKYTINTLYDVLLHDEYQKELNDLAYIQSENPNPVMRFSRDGIINHANQASVPFLKMWKTKVGSTVPKEIFRWFLTKKKKNLEISDSEIICDKKTYLFTISYQKNDGSIFFMRRISLCKKPLRTI